MGCAHPLHGRGAGRDRQQYRRARHPIHRDRAQELAVRRIEGRRRTRRRYLLGHRDGQAQWRRAAGLYRRCHREDRLRLARIPLGRAHAVELAVRAAADRSGRVTEVFRPRLPRTCAALHSSSVSTGSDCCGKASPRCNSWSARALASSPTSMLRVITPILTSSYREARTLADPPSRRLDTARGRNDDQRLILAVERWAKERAITALASVGNGTASAIVDAVAPPRIAVVLAVAVISFVAVGLHIGKIGRAHV